jgi:hypothetical protein
LNLFGLATGIKFFDHEMGKLRDIVVTTCWFALPQLKVLLPSVPESRKLLDKPGHYLCFRRFVVTVENPIRIVGHAILS